MPGFVGKNLPVIQSVVSYFSCVGKREKGERGGGGLREGPLNNFLAEANLREGAQQGICGK